MFEELKKQVLQWAVEKGILDANNPQRQAFKTLEECGELVAAVAKNDRAEIKDAIGDVLVTLIIQAEMQGFDIEWCLSSAYSEIKNRTGKIVNGTFVKDEQPAEAI